MKMNLLKPWSAMVFFLVFNINLYAGSPDHPSETVVNKLYELVTFDKGTTPDWNKVRQLFLDDAVIVLRTTRTENKVMNLDGFVGDFKHFIESAKVIETGFSETIVKTKGKVFGDIAWYSVLYKAEIPGTERGNLGVDHFSLVKTNGEWKIVSITNEVPTKENPVPEELQN